MISLGRITSATADGAIVGRLIEENDRSETDAAVAGIADEIGVERDKR
jgi:hypothetical protein